MIYIIYGKIDYLLKKNIKKILEENKINEIDIITYDLMENSMEQIINDANSLSLFDSKKVIIVKNSYIFTSITVKKEVEQNIKMLEQYLDNINETTILIFTTSAEKLDERKKVVKLANKVAKIIECNNIDITKTVRCFFENYKISDSCIKLLIEKVGEDINLLNNEIEKLKLYKNDNTVDEEDIINVTCKTFEENNFKLIDAIINKNKPLAIELYEERLKLNEEPIAIVISLANQIRILYQVKQLYMLGHTENDIIAILGIHPYRVKLAIKNASKFELDELINILSGLADLDYNIKTGNINKELGFEMFILKI